MTCNPCPEARRAYNRSRRDRVLKRKHQYAQEKPEHNLLMKRWRRVKGTDIAFTITEKDVIIPTHCPVLGIPLLIKPSMKDRERSAVIDRINPKRGYVPGNIVVISYRANRIKSDATLKELKALVRWLKGVKAGQKGESK